MLLLYLAISKYKKNNLFLKFETLNEARIKETSNDGIT
jgi:hypothetical protein